MFDESFDFVNYQAKQIADPSNYTDAEAKKETIASRNERVKQALADFNGIYAYKADQHAQKYHIEANELILVVKPLGCQLINVTEHNNGNNPRSLSPSFRL